MSRALAFGSVAEAYVRGRPSYAEEAVRFALPRVPCAVADVGAGTGKLTEVLVRLGCAVVAVEPDDAMRALIRGADVRAGTAEALPLEDASVDAVVAAQAFHWFDAPRFVAEALRVLRPGGTIGILRNDLDPGFDWINDFGRAVAPPDRPLVADDLTEAPLADDRLAPARYGEAPYLHRLDAHGVAAFVASLSPVALLPEERRAELLAEVVRVTRSRLGEQVELPYTTRAWRYELRSMDPQIR